MSRNLAASVRARLKQHADANKQDFNLTLTHYGLERLLYRLSVSEHASNFLLKGALLFTLWYDVAHRPTRDADLLGFGPDDVNTAVSTFREICLTQLLLKTGWCLTLIQSRVRSFAKRQAMVECGSTCRQS
jgi:hypothetical protein